MKGEYILKIIAINNQKGGTGKTTTAAALGFGLYHRGYKILLIDLDGQGNLSYTVDADCDKYGAFCIMERPSLPRRRPSNTISDTISESEVQGHEEHSDS